ncbi:MAG: hypothetical protein HZA51_12285 [Planctomycetes bacterium]|nr:hypothetical protein [Planctomycetota bacterium]
MARKHLKAFLSTMVLVFVCGMLVVLWTKTPIRTRETGEKPRVAPAVMPVPTPAYVRRLTDAGWDSRAARAVVELNSKWFEIQTEENPAGLELQLKLLEGLGQHSTLARFISEHPETAGLLAVADDPELIAAGLDSAYEDYQIVAGLYVQHAAPRDAADVAAALKANRDLICALHRRGLLGCEVLFIFDRQDVAAEEYETWLREAIQAKSAASDAELASFVNLAMRHGPALRDRLKHSEDFRRRLRSELWPRLSRAVDGEHAMFEQYLDEKRIWDLLALDNGEELLKRCGLLPIDLLYGYPEIDHVPYPKVLHDKIVQMLLRREERTIHALMKFRREPLFHKFMQRDLSSDTLSAALAQLFNAGPNYPDRLALYARIDDKALADEVGPPNSGIVTWIPFYYTVYEVPQKLLQGRDPSGMDLFSAVVDPVFLVLDIYTGGGTAVGRKALLVGGKEVTEVATRKLAEKGGAQLFVTALRDTGLELARKQVGKEIAEKMGEKELVNWTITGTLSEMQQAVRTTIGMATAFEITRPLQFMFQYGRVGRETWKRITGMEARLFMRGDAKVFVRITNLAGAVVGSRTAAFFERTAQDLALGAAFESEPGQDLLHEAVKRVLSSKEQLQAWQQNVSAWWLRNACQNTAQPEGTEVPR